MKKVTKEIVNAFLNGKYKKVGNSESSGGDLFLHHNKIAYFDIDGFLWISNAGWESNTTKERLNALPNVSIYYPPLSSSLLPNKLLQCLFNLQ